MQLSYKATSIIESMVVLLIVVTGITGVYSLLNSSQKLANSTTKRIEAIQIARDGLEAFTTIRNTNWLKYGADYTNCWNVLNYNPNCIGNTSTTYDIRYTGNRGFIVYKNGFNQFELSAQVLPGGLNEYSNATYRNRFAIEKDTDGFYTQSGGTLYGTGSDPFYTREIQINYINDSGSSVGSASSNNNQVKVTSIVQWIDTAKSTPQKLEMSTILTNWKSKQ